MVGTADLPEYTAHELPLPLFDLGHDRACTSVERLYPLLGGKHELQGSNVETASTLIRLWL